MQKPDIHDHILQEIVKGNIRPGDTIDEDAIARLFGVSKTPIREAILQLTANGIVAKAPRAGAKITKLAPEELIELIELHSELEGAAAYHAARRGTQEQIRALKQAANAYAAFESAPVKSRPGAYDLNLNFHLSVFKSANNKALQDALDISGVRLVSYFRAQEELRKGEGRAVREHDDILNAIAEKRSDDARTAMRRHAEISSDTLLDVLSLMRDR